MLQMLSGGIFKTKFKVGFRAQKSPDFESISRPAVLLLILSLLYETKMGQLI